MSALFTSVNPGFLLLLTGLIGGLLPVKPLRQGLMILAPVLGIIMLTQAPRDLDLATGQALGLELVLYRVDSLNFLFGLAFLVAAFLHAIYALHNDDRLHDGAAMFYAGTAVSACFAGDLVSLFIFWELTAVASVFLVLRARTRAAYNAGMRYLVVQVLSGVLFLDGIAYVYKKTGSLDLSAFGSLDAPGAKYILLAVAIKAAFPLLHNWVQDAYPKATIVGGVVLSAFTTKLAVLMLARLYPGLDMLIWIGVLMAVFPIFFAILEDDLRRVLAYGLNSQIGFMVCAVGLGDLSTRLGQMALNAAAAHAFVHIIFSSLLFMSIGAVLYRTGTAKASELGGLYRRMPFTALFGLVGAAAIAAVPMFSGYVAISQITSTVAQAGPVMAWLGLVFASAGVWVHSGLKVPYTAFFGRDRGHRVAEAPFNMLLAMGIAAAICILAGLPVVGGFGYGWLYSLLPFPDHAAGFRPYSAGQVIAQLQLLVAGIAAFMLLRRFGLYPGERAGTVLDTDWIYRRLAYGLAIWADAVWEKAGPAILAAFGAVSARAYDRIEAAFSPRGVLSRGPLTGGMAIWTAALLGFALLLAFITVN